MGTFQISETVGEIVARRPGLSRVFEKAGIDYCCGGKLPLEEACQKKGIDPQAVLASLEALEQSNTQEEPIVDAAAMSLTELVDHIVETHHNFLRSELPRLGKMTARVAAVHGDKDARLVQVNETFRAMAEELTSHMMKEEQILFPMIRALDASETTPEFHCGSASNPIRQMESEHDDAGSALETLRRITDSYTPPDWACNTYRAMLDGLANLETDLHQHIHKENNVLFPRTIEMESDRTGLAD